MALTLYDAKITMADKVDQQVVDMFRRNSVLLDSLTFDNVISPGTGGSTLTYGYVQLASPSVASIRDIGQEFTPGEAVREVMTTQAVILGGSFQLDRVLQNTSGAADELAFQAEQKIKATANYFNFLAINGSSEDGAFDGLSRLLEGSDSVMNSQVDLSTDEALGNNYHAFLDELDKMIACMDSTPDMLLMNTDMLIKMRAVARRAGCYERTTDGFGRSVETYAGIPLVDMGKYFDGENNLDVIETDAGCTSIYAVCLGLDGLHGISPQGTGVIVSYMPDLNAPGAQKTGEVELVAGIALKSTKKAAVLRDVQIRKP